MKILSRALFAIIITISIAFDVMATQKLTTVDILGKTYYIYEIKKGDSLFSISREYGWNYDELCKLNPSAVSPLEKGMKIYYPVKETVVNNSDNNSASHESQTLNHLVKRGETVFAISKMYDIPQETIFKLNPGSNTGIKEGQLLLLSENNPNSEDIKFYVIRKGDTLYSVAKNNSTTVAAIMKKNPGVTEKNFRAGDTILLPSKGEGVKSMVESVAEENLASFTTLKVGKNDTWESISEKTGVDKEDLVEANRGTGSKPKNKSLISVPNIETKMVEKTIIEEDPREQSEAGIAEIYEDVHGISEINGDREFKMTLLLSEPASRKDLEFTRGVLAGLDRMKRSGMKVNVSILNGNRTSTEILTELSEIDPDLLLLTTEKGIPAYISEYAEVSQTPTVNTFDVKNELYATNPYIIQLLTPSNYFNEEIAARIAKDFIGRNLIMVGTEYSSDQLAASLKDVWNSTDIKDMSIDGLGALNVKDDSRYLIYGYANKKDEVSELLNTVNELKREHPLADISVIGRPGWIVYDDAAMEEKYHTADVLIPSRFYYDKDSGQARTFENHYNSLFDREPAKSFPMYAALGYDTSMYFIPSLINAELDINNIGSYENGVQSAFEIYRPGNWTGMLNPVVYLVRFTPFGTIDKIAVK